MCARLSPIAYEPINRAATPSPAPTPVPAGLRTFHDPIQEADAPDTPGSTNVMKWWRREPARPVNTDPDLARIRQEPSVTPAAG
jgi:hypothetical protein